MAPTVRSRTAQLVEVTVIDRASGITPGVSVFISDVSEPVGLPEITFASQLQ
jgi:hypothetical protein